MKKLLTLFLLTALLFTLCTGCGESSADDHPSDTTKADVTTAPTQDEPVAVAYKYAADKLFNGSINDDRGSLSVGILSSGVFMGNTVYDDLGNAYSNAPGLDVLLSGLEEIFPNRYIEISSKCTSNIGSGYAAAFYGAIFADASPDIVIIDLLPGDAGMSEEELRENYTSIIKQAQAQPKVPVLCFVYTMPPYAESEEGYAPYGDAIKVIDSVAAEYGIMTFDTNAVLRKSCEDAGEDFAALRTTYYDVVSATPSNGPGYIAVVRPFTDAIAADPAAFFVKLPEADGLAPDLYLPDDKRLVYEGSWNTYSAEAPFVPDGSVSGELMKIDESLYLFPNMYGGIAETSVAGSSVAFDTKASSFAILTHENMRGAVMSVYLDDEFLCAINTNGGDRKKGLTDEALYTDAVRNIIDGVSSNGAVTVSLPGDGETHNVKLIAEDISGSHLAFRFGYIVTLTDGKYCEKKEPVAEVEKTKPYIVPATEKTYGADGLVGEDGKLGNNDSGDLRVVFIGGSLTEQVDTVLYINDDGTETSGLSWPYMTVDYLKEKFPNKNITGFNAGVGGIGSTHGAMRFAKTVLELEPDIVFIDFAANDNGTNRKFGQIYMEQMVRMAKEAKKEPVVVFLYMPLPENEGSDSRQGLQLQVDYKEEIAQWYGVGSINIQDYITRKFEKSGESDFQQFLRNYYIGTPGNYNLHGGYQLYYEAITEVLESDAGSVIHRMNGNDDYFENGLYKEFSDRRYVLHGPNDEALTYTGTWTLYNHKNLQAHDMSEGNFFVYHQMTYPLGMDGIMESVESGATVSLKTKAAEISVSFPSIVAGNNAVATLDGEEIGVVNCTAAPYNGMSYLVRFDLPDDGEEHTFTLTTKEKPLPNSNFAFTYIIESLHTGK